MFASRKFIWPVLSVFMILSLLSQQSFMVKAVEQGETMQPGELPIEQVIKGPQSEVVETKEEKIKDQEPRFIIQPQPPIVGIQGCVSPLDYNTTAGELIPDGQLALSDAVEFTQRYESAKGSQSGDSSYDQTVDINYDGKVSPADYFCAQPYYANAGPYSCQIDCSNACHNPLDYDNDYSLSVSDAVTFTHYYTAGDLQADINNNGYVDYGDYNCSLNPLGNSDYQCPLQCAAICGDHTIQARLGEQCDDGNQTEGDGCSATCKIETSCDRSVADYNHDGQVTLADAVLFTPFYLNQQAEGDIDTNGETRLHDKLCMDAFLNEPAPQPVQFEVPQPIGIPTQYTEPEAQTGSGLGGTLTLPSQNYDLGQVVSQTSASQAIYPGRILALQQPQVKNIQQPVGTATKEAVSQTKRSSLLVVAPAAKEEVVALTGSPVIPTVTATANPTSQPSLWDKIVNFFTQLF